MTFWDEDLRELGLQDLWIILLWYKFWGPEEFQWIPREKSQIGKEFHFQKVLINFVYDYVILNKF